MSDPVVSLMPVRLAELVVGKPLRETIYDWHGNVLLVAGYVLENQAQVDDLIENGFIKDSVWDLTPPPPCPSMSMAQSKKPVSAARRKKMSTLARMSLSPCTLVCRRDPLSSADRQFGRPIHGAHDRLRQEQDSVRYGAGHRRQI